MTEPQPGTSTSDDERQLATGPAAARLSRRGRAAILSLAALGLVFIGLRLFAFAPYSIPASSMYPTLLIGDYMVVSIYSYGYGRYTLPLAPRDFEGRLWAGPVTRGDVAVFRNPANLSEDYVKRIVGLPGDRIQMRDGILHINGAAVERQRIEDFALGTEGAAPQYLEILPNGREHRIVEAYGDRARSDNTREFMVPADHYFALGDNRDNSMDSRIIGFIPADNLVGRAEIVLFSFDAFRLRPERLFHRIE